MPRQRKSLNHESLFLTRDAQPLWSEIEGEPDPEKRAEAERRRDDAEDALISKYLAKEKQGRLHELNLDIRECCEVIRARHGGEFPRPRGGRPKVEDLHLRIHVAVCQEIQRDPVRKGRKTRALHTVAACFNCSYEAVRGVYYCKDPEWLRAVALQMMIDAQNPVEPVAADDGRSPGETQNPSVRGTLLERTSP